MPTKLELAKQLEAAMGTASINGAAEYAKRTKAWLENQLHLHAWFSRTEAGFNQALNVRLATNAEGHKAEHTCNVRGRWIGHMGQLWAFRLNQGKIAEARPTHQPTCMDWALIDAYCIECASS